VKLDGAAVVAVVAAAVAYQAVIAGRAAPAHAFAVGWAGVAADVGDVSEGIHREDHALAVAEDFAMDACGADQVGDAG
jgi:hypothetical protein